MWSGWQEERQSSPACLLVTAEQTFLCNCGCSLGQPGSQAVPGKRTLCVPEVGICQTLRQAWLRVLQPLRAAGTAVALAPLGQTELTKCANSGHEHWCPPSSGLQRPQFTLRPGRFGCLQVFASSEGSREVSWAPLRRHSSGWGCVATTATRCRCLLGQAGHC